MRTRFSAQALADPDAKSSEREIRRCVHCGFCQATCPTYVLLGDELDSPRGRIRLIQEMLESRASPSAETVKHVDRCLSCLSCVTTCPSGVNYARLIDHARAYIEARYRRPLADRLWRSMLAAVLPSPDRLALALAWSRAARPLAPLLEGVLALKPLAAMLRLSPARLPMKSSVDPLPPPTNRPRVALLGGCAETVLRPEVRAASLRLITRMGFAVGVASGEVCCGALVQHLGRQSDARAAARRNVEAWSREIDAGGLSAIVATASGCGTMLKDYGWILRDDPVWAEKASRVSALVKDVGEFVEGAGLPPLHRPAAPLSVAYLAPCSLQHGQSAGSAPARLMAAAGFDVREPTESHLCCGSAGTYNILQGGIADALGRRKAERLQATGGAIVAAGNIGCLTQIDRWLGCPTVHPVELLDWATGGPPPPHLEEATSSGSLIQPAGVDLA